MTGDGEPFARVPVALISVIWAVPFVGATVSNPTSSEKPVDGGEV